MCIFYPKTLFPPKTDVEFTTIPWKSSGNGKGRSMPLIVDVNRWDIESTVMEISLAVHGVHFLYKFGIH